MTLKTLFLRWWGTLESKATLWLMIILLISLSVRLAALFVVHVSVMDEASFRRQLIATNVVEGRGYTFCSSYFPFCGPNNDQTASVGPVSVLCFAALIVVF